MKQELESILSFGAQAVSGEKTIFDQAALRHLDRLMEGQQRLQDHPCQPAVVLSQNCGRGTAQNGHAPLAVIVCCSDSRAAGAYLPRLRSENCSSSATQATSSVTLPWAAGIRRRAPGDAPGGGHGTTGCGAVGTALTPAQEKGGLAAIGRDSGRHRFMRPTPIRPCAGTPLHALASVGTQPHLEGAAPGGQGGVRRRHL